MDSEPNETDEEIETEGITEVADSLRSDQWFTYVVAVGAGLVVSTVLVFVIVDRVFLETGILPEAGPAHANSEEGIDGYMKSRIIPQLEMKYTTKEHSEVSCEQRADVETVEPGRYTSKVHCERPDAVVKIDVEVTHDGERLSWDSEIRETVAR